MLVSWNGQPLDRLTIPARPLPTRDISVTASLNISRSCPPTPSFCCEIDWIAFISGLTGVGSSIASIQDCGIFDCCMQATP